MPLVPRVWRANSVPSREGWAGRELWYRLLIIVMLWLAYSVMLATTVWYARDRDVFSNISGAPALIDVVPMQFVVSIHIIVYIFQFFFILHSALATLAQLTAHQTPLPVIPYYIVILVLHLFQIFSIQDSRFIVSAALNFVCFILLIHCLGLVLKAKWRVTSRPFYILVVNPMSVFISFSFLSVLYSIAAYFKTNTDYDFEFVKISVFSVLLSSVIIFVPFDEVVIYKYTKRIIAYYIPLLACTISCILQFEPNFDDKFYVVLFITLLVVIISFLVKFLRYVINMCREIREGRREKRMTNIKASVKSNNAENGNEVTENNEIRRNGKKKKEKRRKKREEDSGYDNTIFVNEVDQATQL